MLTAPFDLPPSPRFQSRSEIPRYGEEGNYNKGYIGFTYDNDNIICEGIAYFTHWERMCQIYATHALIVTGENKCIESHLESGVRHAHLDRYFNNPRCQIFFRKPLGLTPSIAERIVQVAQSEVGKKYDFRLIISQALTGTTLGHILNKILVGKLEDLIAGALNDPNRWICSELVAYCLNAQNEYKNKGILVRLSHTISPQELFEDPVIFEPWKDSITECSDNPLSC